MCFECHTAVICNADFRGVLMGRGVLLSVMCGWVLYSLLYGVIKVMDDLFAETFNLFVFSQSSNVFMYVLENSSLIERV